MKRLSSLTIFPVKGCKGISLEKTSVTLRGPSFDRRWMAVDEQGTFLSQRKFPKMALIETALKEDFLWIKLKDMQLKLPLFPEGEKRHVMIWNDACEAIDLGEEAAQKLSQFLETSCRLVYMPDSTHRPVSPTYAIDEKSSVGFADRYPFLLISEASLEELNSRLVEPVPMNRFRPNLVISGCTPYEEDTWKWIRIGEIRFKVAKPCSRCGVTTVDQATGIKGIEPLQTLASYRKQEKGVMFGQNLIPAITGELQLGDIVDIIS